MGEHGKGFFKCDQIPWVGGMIGDLAHQPLQVVDRRKILPDLFPGNGLLLELLYCVKALFDFFFCDQRLLDAFAQCTGAHGRFCFIKNPQKRPSFLFFSECLAKFQISARRAVQEHISSAVINGQIGDVGQILLLGFQQIFQQRSGSDHTAVIVGKPQSFQCTDMKMVFQSLSADRVIKIPGIQGIDGDAKLLL